MNTGCARILVATALLLALGGCAGSGPEVLISAAELESMIQVQVEVLEPAPADEAMVAAVQP